MVSERLVSRTDQEVPRHPDTGIMVGAEELTLGPEGAATAVLFVHGFIGGTNNFAALPRQVAEAGCFVRAIRLPGHGTSPRDLEETTNEEMVEAVRTEFDQLAAKHKRVVLIGHSMGGTIVTLVAADREPAGLVLAAPYYGVTHHWYYVLRPEKWTSIIEGKVDWLPVFRWLYKGEAFKQVARKEVKGDIVAYRWVGLHSISQLNDLGVRGRQPDVLRKVDCPVLMLHSRHDVAASPDRAEEAFEQLGSVSKKLVWLDKSNHILFWDYEREKVADEVLDFLRCLPTEDKKTR